MTLHDSHIRRAAIHIINAMASELYRFCIKPEYGGYKGKNWKEGANYCQSVIEEWTARYRAGKQ